MKYTYYLYTLPSGHTIITPHGKEISEEEYKEYFDIASNWLKETRPNASKEINPQLDNQKTYESMINKMFEAYPYDENGMLERYFLNKRTLTFIFIISYLIQKENRKGINPFLSHAMGNALLLWLPIKELVEYYLSLSAEAGRGSNLSDGFLLVRMFCPNIGFSNYGFDSDVDKALKYATILYNNPLNEHKLDNYDYAYARALFEKDNNNADECLEIINKKLYKYNIEYEEYTNVLLNYLILELEIVSKVKSIKANLDLNYIEEILSKEGKYSSRRNLGYYWLAQCYISGKNNNKGINKAISLLTNIKDPSLYKKAGASLASLYLTGDGVDYDPKEALDIISIAEGQANSHPYCRDVDEELLKIKETALSKIRQERYIKLLNKIVDIPIYYVDIDTVEAYSKLHLSDEEYDYLFNDYFVNGNEIELLRRIIKKLRHPALTRRLEAACNKMVYIGSDEKKRDYYLNFEECGNMFIHGVSGAGKTYYIHSIFKRLKNRESSKKINIAFWSFKPFEFEKWCDDYLIKDPHDFIKRIKELNNNQTIIFIDEFDELIESLNDKEKGILLDMFKNSKNRNICFICCSQHMNNYLKDYGEYVSTRICMMCHKKEESISMIGSDIAISIEKYGNMFVQNNKQQPCMRKVYEYRN